LAATAKLFAANGYDRLTIEGIAAEAHVGKQTIYRWWGSKSALVAETLLEGMLEPKIFTPPDSGDIRVDLRDWLEVVFAFIDDPANASFIRSILAAATQNADVGRHLGEVLGAGFALHAQFERAAQAGQIPPGTPLEELTKALVGFAILHALERSPAPAGFADRLVGLVLPPAQPAGGAGGVGSPGGVGRRAPTGAAGRGGAGAAGRSPAAPGGGRSGLGA
jgi:AcrR family transcriptional regulator